MKEPTYYPSASEACPKVTFKESFSLLIKDKNYIWLTIGFSLAYSNYHSTAVTIS